MAEALSRSSSMADEEEEVFEITDFTTVSDWEKFIAQISEAVSDWQLTCIDHVRPLKRHEITLGSWEQLSKEIRFSNAIFMLTLYRLKQSGDDDVYFEESETNLEDELHLPAYMDDMMSTSNDFPPRAHCLVRWYGFRSFLVLSLVSSGNKGVEGLTSESKCNLLLSSACIMLSESGCEVPMFIQIQQNWRKMFTGRCVGTGMLTEFEMVHLKKCPPQYKHLSGLLHVFKSKIGKLISPVQVSARFSYVLSNWGASGTWPPEQVDPDFAAQTLDKFLFGCLEDPISDLHLSAVWPSITEDLIIENDVHSDFNPLTAPVWTIKLLYTDNPECLLSGYIKEMVKLRNCGDTFSGLIKTAVNTQESEQDIGQALSKLTDSSHKVRQMVPLMPELTSGISKIVTKPRSMWAKRMKYASFTTLGPISQHMMELMMEFLLPEESRGAIDENTQSTSSYDSKDLLMQDIEHQIKSAPRDSLTYRLATCLTVANYCHGGITAIAQVWHEFIQEMRYRFENGVLITGVKTDNPDLRCCLLHQKLQMLNCCINHKIVREKNQSVLKEEGDDQGNPVDESHGLNEEDVEESTADDSVVENESESCKEEDETPPDDQEKIGGAETVERKESSVSLASQSPPGSAGWQEEVSSIEDEFFDCEDGDDEKETGDKGADKNDDTITDKNDDKRVPSPMQVDPMEDTDENLTDNIRVKDADKIDNTDKDQSDETDKDDKVEESTVSSVDVPTDSTAKPVGRLKRFGSEKLLNFDVPLFIPVTQEPAPLTEDVLEEQTKIFSSLGDSAEGARLRRKMQSASLLSDMESFKAANPGCVLADFVRWYSPRDYEEVGGVGGLSERMRIPGNLWQTMWDSAKPTAARRQKRLFDDTKEGEKVLHFLSSLEPKDLIILLLPMCFHEAVSILHGKSDQNLASVPTLCKQILSQCGKLFQGNFKDKFAQMDDIFQKILFTETLIERSFSLRHKFAKVKNSEVFVRRLIENPEVLIEGAANGIVGDIIKQYFFDQASATASQYSTEVETASSRQQVNSLPSPRGREYILRSTAPRPSAQSRVLPHRMYTVLMKNEFRLAGAFSSDTVFF